MLYPNQKGSLKNVGNQQQDVDQRRMTATKFNKFITGAIRESRAVDERQSMRRQTIQRRVTSIMNGSFLDRRTSSKLEQSQLHLIQRLNSRVRQESIIANDFLHKIDQEIDDEILLKSHMKHILLCQRLLRGKKVRKNIAKQMKNHRYRKFVILELLTTESGYTHDLELLQDYAYKKLKESNLVKQEHLEVLIGNLSELTQFHRTLTDELQALDKGDFNYILKVGTTYHKYIDGFKQYYDYCHNFNKAETLYKDLKKNEKLNIFFANMKQDGKLRFLGWEGFVVKPIQRLPKYNLFLNDFLKHCEPDHRFHKVFRDLQSKFLEVCEENNKHIHSLANSLKLLELEKYFGQPNQLCLMNRTLVKEEEKMTFLVDGFEKHMLVYVFNDLILICEADPKEELGYKLYRHAVLTENSYCQSMPNKRYFSNLTKLICKNITITIMSATPELKSALIDSINYLIANLKSKTTKKCSKEAGCPHQIDVQVIGTEDRSGVTIYVVKVVIGKVVSDIFIRYSEIKGLSDLLVKEQADHQFPQIKTGNWIGNKDSKIIEQRKMEIEDFIQSLLVNDEFYHLEKNFQAKYLSVLGLETYFFDLPQMLQEVEKQAPTASKVTSSQSPQKPRLSIFNIGASHDTTNLSSIGGTTDGKINASTLIKVYQQVISNESTQSTLTESIILNPRNMETMDANVVFHDGRKIELKIPTWYRGADLVLEVAKKIGLKDACDFRLFETDDTMEKFRPILDDEIMEQLLKKEKRLGGLLSFFKKKVLVFRKYLYFPRKFEEIQQNLQGQGDKCRLDLILSQALFDIKRKQYIFPLKDYCLIVAFELIYNPPPKQSFIQKSNFSFDWVKKIVPETYVKEQSKQSWATCILSLYNDFQIQISQICLLSQRMNETEDGIDKYQAEQELEEKVLTFNQQYVASGSDDTRNQFFQIQANKTVVAAIMLLNLISQHKNYGITFYSIQVDQNNFDLLWKLVWGLCKKQIRKTGLAVGVSIDGLTIFDETRNTPYVVIRFDEIDVEAHSDQLTLTFDEKNSKIVAQQQSILALKDTSLQMVFQTQQGFQIAKLISEYEYLQDELIQIDSMG